MENIETPYGTGGIYNYFSGATIHNFVINNGNYYDQRGGTPAGNVKYNDEQVAQALENIVGKGKAIDTKQKWAGAVWFLRWTCNYPQNARQACERINRLPFSRELEYTCDYNNIRALTTLSFLNENPAQMDAVRYSKGDEQAFFQLREVVVALQDELLKISRPAMSC